jgi:hypothetical protein
MSQLLFFGRYHEERKIWQLKFLGISLAVTLSVHQFLLWSGSGQEMNGVNNSGGLLGSY